jgi:hypothetical protein
MDLNGSHFFFFLSEQYRGNRIKGGVFSTLKQNGGRENGGGRWIASKNLMGSDPFSNMVYPGISASRQFRS